MNHNVKRTALTKEEAYQAIWKESQGGAYVSYLRGKHCKTEGDFLIQAAVSFQFPYYYGENWAAFDECIQDLEWLNFSKIFVIFDDFSQAFRDQPAIQSMLQNRVSEYWSRAIDYWAEEGKTVAVWLNN
jgi:hypothetical protein